MKKRIVICADGTWNRPENDLGKDFPTNVLELARSINPAGHDGVPQQVFYVPTTCPSTTARAGC